MNRMHEGDHDPDTLSLLQKLQVPSTKSFLKMVMKRRVPKSLLVVLTTVAILGLVQVGRLSRLPGLGEADPDPLPRTQKLAVVNFVDSKNEYLWGVYSIHNQLKKFNMTPRVDHVALVASDMKGKSRALLEEWLGPDNIRVINKDIVRDLVPKGRSLWIPVFSKTEAFNMTDYDKLIVLDNDIFIRKNIMHWFRYPTPAATQARGTIEWNSGAMVIEPSTKLYNSLLEHIPLTRAWRPSEDDGNDTWNSKDGQQGFLSSFFLSNATDDTMFTMSYGCSILSTDLEKFKENHYFWNYRRDAIETIHFTQHKPWKEVTETNHPAVCEALREWLDSVADAPKEKLPELPDILRECPPAAEDTIRRAHSLGRKTKQRKKQLNTKKI